jgi:transcriptional regulator of acetoin/glycerol metabolism
MTDGDRIDVDDLPFHRGNAADEATDMSVDSMLRHVAPDLAGSGDSGVAKDWPYSLESVIREASKLALIRALQATQGNCHHAAELLGVSRYTVYRVLNRFGLAEGLTYRTSRKPTEV